MAIDVYAPISDDGVHQHLRWLTDFVDKDVWANPWTAERILGWMCGIGLPPVGQSEMPYVLIWEGIEASQNRDDLKRRFAEALVACAQGIDDNLFPKRSKFLEQYEQYPGEAAANLWSLTALLEQPILLGPWIRRTVQTFPCATWLNRKAMEPIRQRLLSAAIFNQDTPEFVPDWKLLVDSQAAQTRFRAGYPADGVEGIAHAPGDDLERLRDITEAIARYARIDFTTDRHKQVVNWLAEVRYRFASRLPDIDKKLFDEADRCKWPDWVTDSLPKTTVDDYIWVPILVACPQSDQASNAAGENVANGRLRRLPDATKEELEMAHRLARQSDPLRLACPYRSKGAKEAIIAEAMRRKREREMAPAGA